MMMMSTRSTRAQQPMQTLDTSRYDLPVPTEADLDAWSESVCSQTWFASGLLLTQTGVQLKNVKAQLEHQDTRIMNLELLAQYGKVS
jgi:hypothetical protein